MLIFTLRSVFNASLNFIVAFLFNFKSFYDKIFKILIWQAGDLILMPCHSKLLTRNLFNQT